VNLEKQALGKWRMISIVLIGLGLAWLSPFTSPAIEIFGIQLWGTKKPPKDESADTIGEAKYYKIDIKSSAQEEKMVKIVRQASTLVADAGRAVSGSAGLIAKARGDYRRILAALYGEGYYGSTISITLNDLEAAELDLDTNLPQESTILITIDAGAQYHFSQIDISPLAQLTTLPPDFTVGAIARSSSILQAEQAVLESWHNQGYAKAQVTRRNVIADHQTHQIEVDIEITPGSLAHYGDVNINNTSPDAHMDKAYIAWMSGLESGSIYDPRQIKGAAKRLARLDVFRSATINEAETIAEDGSLPISINVQERAPRRFGAGASYATLDGAGFEDYWLHRNLFGHAERLRFDAKISGIGSNQDNSFHPENYSYQLGASFTRPGILTPDTDFISSLKANREVLENYTATGLYLQSGLTHIFNDQLQARLVFDASRIRTKDDYFGSRNFTLVGLDGRVEFDNRDDAKNAKSGLYAQATLKPIYEAEYGHVIAASTIEGRIYYKIDQQGRFVLAGRGKIGAIIGATPQHIPSNMLFFAGGGGSVRGFGYRNIGIISPTGEVIGGRSLLETAGEARVEVTQDIGLVGFVDAGQVGEQSYPDFSNSLKWGAGLGLRYNTGLGPLRLDVARPLNGEKGDPDLGLYIGIGQAF